MKIKEILTPEEIKEIERIAKIWDFSESKKIIRLYMPTIELKIHRKFTDKEICKICKINYKEVKNLFQWLKNDPMIETPQGKRLTRELYIYADNKENKVKIEEAKRNYDEKGNFTFFSKYDKKIERERTLICYGFDFLVNKRDIIITI